MRRNLETEAHPSRDQRLDGQVRLWASVVRLAAADLFKEAQPYGAQARAWFMSDSEHIGSFIWCADQLGLDAAAVRDKMHNGGMKDLKHRYANYLRVHNKGRNKPRDAPDDQEV